MAPQKHPFGVPLETQVHKFWNLRSPKKWLNKKLSKMSECNENGCPNGLQGRCEWACFAHQLRMFSQNRCKAAPDTQNHRFLMTIWSTSDPKTDPSGFSLFPSQHLWRTWGPQPGPKFPNLRSLIFLLNVRGEPPSCTFYTFLGVRRCHAAQRLQYIYVQYTYIYDIHNINIVCTSSTQYIHYIFSQYIQYVFYIRIQHWQSTYYRNAIFYIYIYIYIYI